MTKIAGNESVLISGRVHIATSVIRLSGATVHIYLEETSAADAPANRLAETQLTLVQPLFPQSWWTVLDFSLQPDSGSILIYPSATYTVRVWIDVDSDGRMGSDDLFSDQAYPVLTHGFSNQVDIRLA